MTHKNQLTNPEEGVVYKIANKEINMDGVSFVATSKNTIIGTGPNSKLSKTDAGAILQSPEGGSGDIFIKDIALEATGSASLWALEDSDGTHTFDLRGVDIFNTDDFGFTDGFRQHFLLIGAWINCKVNWKPRGTWQGFKATEMRLICTSMEAGDYLFNVEGGSDWLVEGSFFFNSFTDFSEAGGFTNASPSNFAAANVFYLDSNRIRTRLDIDSSYTYSNDMSVIMPNISATDLQSFWKGNIGMPNTTGGIEFVVQQAVATPLSGVPLSEYVELAYNAVPETWQAINAVHMSQESAGSARAKNDDQYAKDLWVSAYIVATGTAGDQIDFKVSTAYFDDLMVLQKTEVQHIPASIRTVPGRGDVTYIYVGFRMTLESGHFTLFEFENNSNQNDVTADLGSVITITWL